MTTTPTAPPFFPARPVNGGPLRKALPKAGDWYYEPKVNGWRALVHCPTGTMFNRRGERLSIESEFAAALGKLHAVLDPHFVWLDVEAFERRHRFGRGSLVILDVPLCLGDYNFRHQAIHAHLVAPGIATSWAHEQLAPPESTVLKFAYMYESIEQQTRHGWKADGCLAPEAAWERLQAVNHSLGAELFEGLVAKRGDSRYPRQLRSPDVEFPFWVKHRWAY